MQEQSTQELSPQIMHSDYVQKQSLEELDVCKFELVIEFQYCLIYQWGILVVDMVCNKFLQNDLAFLCEWAVLLLLDDPEPDEVSQGVPLPEGVLIPLNTPDQSRIALECFLLLVFCRDVGE